MRRTSSTAGAALVGKSVLLDAEPIVASPRIVPPSETLRFLGTRGTVEIRGNQVSVLPQDGRDLAPCHYISSYSPQMRAEFVKKCVPGSTAAPETAESIVATTYHAPPGYNEDRQHLLDFFQSARTRRPSVEDPVFGNNAAIGCHLANYSYFHKSVALWDNAARAIKG